MLWEFTGREDEGKRICKSFLFQAKMHIHIHVVVNNMEMIGWEKAADKTKVIYERRAMAANNEVRMKKPGKRMQ